MARRATRPAVIAAVLALAGCREGEPASVAGNEAPAATETSPATAPEKRDAPADSEPPEEEAPPVSLEEGVGKLRAAGFAQSAAAIERRVAQRSKKMRLTRDEGLAAAIALLELAEREAFQKLHQVMPRSTVELARAVAERGVPVDDAVAIADYLVRFVKVLDFEQLAVFDGNHSHVTGRRWREIDYSGEGMSWQKQRAFWKPRGVESFRTVESIHAYFVGAAQLPHWQRVYQPRGKVGDVSPP